MERRDTTERRRDTTLLINIIILRRINIEPDLGEEDCGAEEASEPQYHCDALHV